MKLIVSTFLVYKVKKCLLKSGKVKHINSNNGYKHPYVFVHGIGKMFPYLRTNVFLTRYEKYNDTSRYKIILFYPGHQEGNSFSLFDTLEDAHTYRATLLVNQ